MPVIQYRSICFTCFNTDKAAEWILQRPKEVRYMVWNHEISPNTGRRHLQGLCRVLQSLFSQKNQKYTRRRNHLPSKTLCYSRRRYFRFQNNSKIFQKPEITVSRKKPVIPNMNPLLNLEISQKVAKVFAMNLSKPNLPWILAKENLKLPKITSLLG